MVTRRGFVAGLGASAVAARVGWAEDGAGVRASVMLWALKGSFADKLRTVAAAGYRQVELVDEWKGWDEAAWTANLRLLRELGLRVDAMAGMKRGFAEVGGGEAFVAELQGLLPVVRRFGCGQVILLSGARDAAAGDERQRAAAVATLGRAARVMEAAGVTGVLEPIDRLEQPTIWMDGVEEAFGLVRAVGSARVRVLYDLYHEQRGRGDLIRKVEENAGLIGLVHVADVPGRHRPGTGEIGYANVYRALRRAGYSGVVAMEFYPEGDAVAELRAAREEMERVVG